MNEKMMRKYANMLARVGVNVQPGQKVLVEACVEGHEFANLFAEEAYKEGAGEVVIHYLDQAFLKTKAQYQSADEVKKIQPVEMFPYTEHLETVVLLTQKERSYG